MSYLNLKWSDGDKNLDLELKDYEEEVLKLIIDTFMSKKTNSMELWKEGYQALMKKEDEEVDQSEMIAVPEKKDQALSEVAATVSQIDIAIPKIDERKQCFYICSCGNKGKHFISSNRTYISCHKCNHKMMVREATNKGPDHADEFGNYYIAGEFKRTMKDKETEDKFWEAKRKDLVSI